MLKRETYKQKAEKLLKQQNRRIKNLRRRGYIIQDIPSIPKRVGKKEYERLKKQLTLENLYNSPKNYYFDKENQRMVSAKKGREMERSKASKKGWQKRKSKEDPEDPTEYPDWYDLVYNGLVEQIAHRGLLPWNTENANILLKLLENAIKEEGRKKALQRIYDEEQQAKFLVEMILPASPRPKQEGYAKIPQFAELLKGSKLDEWEMVELEDYMDNIEMFIFDYDENFDGEYDTYY